METNKTPTALRLNGITYTATTSRNVTILRRTTQRGRAVRVDLLDATVTAGVVTSYTIRTDW